MVKRALLVGCNYPGTDAELRGCINDVWGMQEMLQKYYGFTAGDMTIMIDTDSRYTKPTGKNMKVTAPSVVIRPFTRPATSVLEVLMMF